VNSVLNQLTPQERRLAVGIGVAFFIFVNYWWVWSHFGDLKQEEGRMVGAQRMLATYKKELAHTNEYLTKIQALQTSGGDIVPEEDQAIEFERYLHRRATESGVAAGIQGNSRPITRTNEFFVDQEMTLNIITEEKNLVDFLASLGASNSLVRVRGMSLKPDAAHQLLNASLTILASYQRKAPSPITAPSATNTTGKPLVPLPTKGTAAPVPGAPKTRPGPKPPGTPGGGPPATNSGAHPRPAPGSPQSPRGQPPGKGTTNSGSQSSKFRPPPPSGTP